MILIYTNKQDEHPTNVIKYLTQWGVPVFRFNTECLLTDYKFEWTCIDGKTDCTIKNIRNGIELKGSEITAIWERRAMIPETLPYEHQEKEINRHNLEEAHGFLSFLRYYMKDIYSIGGIVNDRYSDSKMLQYRVAHTLGMRVPDTCFSNNATDIRNFAKTHKQLSLKPISENSVYVDDEFEYAFYTKRVKDSDILSQPDIALEQTVSYIQEYIDKAYELRITVIGEDIVACKIDSQSQGDETGKVDWRQGYEHNLKQEIVEIPTKIGTFCKNYMKTLGLNFSCFDFIVTPSQDYVFVECNPNGQWLWIELETGFDISKIIAKNLAKYEQIGL
ncbi:MAG: hypothetical protein MJZ23_08280 [Paludibacteraceae bacterium]|nr:hypothetical protein [Paludibacteraceae bacterium]